MIIIKNSLQANWLKGLKFMVGFEKGYFQIRNYPYARLPELKEIQEEQHEELAYIRLIHLNEKSNRVLDK